MYSLYSKFIDILISQGILFLIYNNFSTYDLTNSTTHNFHAYSSIIPRYKSDIQVLNDSSSTLPLSSTLQYPHIIAQTTSEKQFNPYTPIHLGEEKEKTFPMNTPRTFPC